MESIRGVAKKVTAITADPQSELAAKCDDVLNLRFRKTGGLTAGTNSFTACLLACFSVLQTLPRLDNLEMIFHEATVLSETKNFSPRGTTYLVGSDMGYPVSVYGAAKISEILGHKAQAEHLEQFSHVELFSLKDDDLVIFLGRPSRKSALLRVRLSEAGFNVFALEFQLKTPAEMAISLSIYLQILVWKNAIDLGVDECAFLMRRELLRISDALIY